MTSWCITHHEQTWVTSHYWWSSFTYDTMMHNTSRTNLIDIWINIQIVSHKKMHLKNKMLNAGHFVPAALRWRHNGRGGVSNHQPHNCSLNRLLRRRSKKTSKLRVTGLCVGNSQGTGEFPAQMANNAENVSIWWHHHGNALKQNCLWTLLLTWFNFNPNMDKQSHAQ